jgi:hypothetical protein
MARPLLANVGNSNPEDSGHDDALQKSPENQLRKTPRSCRHYCGQGKQKNGGNDYLAPTDALSKSSAEWRAERNAKGCGADGSSHLGFGGVEYLLKEWQQRLCGVEIEKRSDPGERYSNYGSRVIAAVRG